MIITLTVTNLLLIASVIYLYLRQLRFEKAVRQFADRLPAFLAPSFPFKGAVIGYLAILLIKKLFFSSDDESS